MLEDIKVLAVGKIEKQLPFNMEFAKNSKEIEPKIAQFKPDIILTIENVPGLISTLSKEVQKKHVHLPADTPEENIINEIINKRTKIISKGLNPLISVYTGTYNTGNMLYDTYNSLKDQTLKSWEWVVVDDGSEDGTYENLLELAKKDFRVRPYKIPRSGKIGQVKDTATRLCYSEYLVELDHDDILVDTCLEKVYNCFLENPEAGMVYTDFAEVMPDGSPHRYHGMPWDEPGMYKEVEYRNKTYLQTCGPDIYDGFSDYTTDRYAYYLTVGPNHARCFRKSTFLQLGGYNRELNVADDYDLYVRMFMRSKIVRIPEMLYIYNFLDNHENTTFTRNKSIQDHLQLCRNKYIEEFHNLNIDRIKETDGFSYFSIIILSWNTKDMTLKCIESALDSLNGRNSEVIVLDNGSTDGSAEAIEERYGDEINLIKYSTNSGFATGCNIAASKAKTYGNPWTHTLLFVNSDCEINHNAVQSVQNALHFGNKIGIAGAYSNCSAYGQIEDQSTGESQPEIEVPFVPGFFLGIRKGLFDDIGGFNSKLTTYEDKDLADKAREKGLKSVLCGGAWVRHHGHASFEAAGLDADEIQAENKPIYESLTANVSAVCIAKDEENAIGEWINQWKGKVKEIIVIVDQGTSDDTLKIASEHGAKVYTYNYDEFAFDEARNYAISKCTQDWVVMLDADERLDNTTSHNLSHLTTLGYDILISPILAQYPDHNKWVIARPFMWRRCDEIKWVSKVHEKLIGSANQCKLTNSVIYHKMELHSDEKRSSKEPIYNKMMSEERFYTDREYRKSIEEKYPILDWHSPEDDRIDDISTGDLISIIMPTYDRGVQLKKSIDSALAQTYKNIELVIVSDNCDKADEVVAEYEDNRIKYVKLNKNHGAGGAIPRNYGADAASGSLIAYLDDDNTWREDHLETLYNSMKKSGSKYSFSSFEMDGYNISCRQPRQYRIDTSCLLLKKSLLDQYGGWKNREEAGYSHDWELVNRWSKEPWSATNRVTLFYDNSVANQPSKEIAEQYGDAINKDYKLCANYLVCDDDYLLRESIESIINHVDFVEVIVNDISFNGERIDNSKSINILDDLAVKYSGRLGYKINYEQESETDQRNRMAQESRNKGFSHILIIDADEVWDEFNIKELIDFSKTMQTDCLMTAMEVYWKDLDRRITPREAFLPAVLMRLCDGVYFMENRIVYADKRETVDGLFFHHYSYVGTDKEIADKIRRFSHSHQLVDNWYEEKWINWNEETVDFHPRDPHLWKSTNVIQNCYLPKPIRNKINNRSNSDAKIAIH